MYGYNALGLEDKKEEEENHNRVLQYRAVSNKALKGLMKWLSIFSSEYHQQTEFFHTAILETFTTHPSSPSKRGKEGEGRKAASFRLASKEEAYMLQHSELKQAAGNPSSDQLEQGH